MHQLMYDILKKSLIESIAFSYRLLNKAPLVILDDHATIYLGPYWFKSKIDNYYIPPSNPSAVLYWRPKSREVCLHIYSHI